MGAVVVIAFALIGATARMATGASSGDGCAKAPKRGTVVLTPKIDGRRRVVRVHVPPNLRARAAAPLVLNLHGSQSTAQAQEAFTGMDATADQNSFLVAYPQAVITSGTGFDWNVPGQPLVGGAAVPKKAADDVSFLEKTVALLEKRNCVDPQRVYVTGFSGGARMASQLGCDASTTFAAIAPVSGLRFPQPCPGTRAVPVVAFHGTEDPIDPIDGNGQPYWTYSVETAAQRWAAHDECSNIGIVADGKTLSRFEYVECSDKGSVVLYEVLGAGHEWPGGPPMPRRITRVLGPQSNAIDADTTMWQFFAQHPLQ